MYMYPSRPFFNTNPYTHSSQLSPRYDDNDDYDDWLYQKAQQRAKKAQYLPHEIDSDNEGDDAYAPSYLGFPSRYPIGGYPMSQPIPKRSAPPSPLKRPKSGPPQGQSEANKSQPKTSVNGSKQKSEKTPPTQRSPTPSSTQQAASSEKPSVNKPTLLPPLSAYQPYHHRSAQKIQKRFRVHRALQKINELKGKFEAAKNRFTFPTSIDFEDPSNSGVVLHVPAESSPPENDMELDGSDSYGKLAYTHANRPIHEYVESLSRLLLQLDEIPSWNSPEVRTSRRNVVKMVEHEATMVDRYWKRAWRDYENNTRNPKSDTKPQTGPDEVLSHQPKRKPSKGNNTRQKGSTQHKAFRPPIQDENASTTPTSSYSIPIHFH